MSTSSSPENVHWIQGRSELTSFWRGEPLEHRQVIRISTFAGSWLSLWLVQQLCFSLVLSRQGSSQIFPFTSKSSLVWQSHRLWLFLKPVWNMQRARTCLSLSYSVGARLGKERVAEASHPLSLIGVSWKCSFHKLKCCTLTWFSLIVCKKCPCVFWCPFLQTHEMKYRGILRFVVFVEP